MAVTSACNNRCRWCYQQELRHSRGGASTSSRGSNGQIRFEDAALVLSTLAEAGTRKCILIGGEPTLHPDLPRLIETVISLGMTCAMVTNGRRAHDMRFAEALAQAGLRLVNVSMHGWSAETYAQLSSSQAAFREAVTGFENLRESGIRTSINIILSRHSAGDVPRMLDFLEGLGVERFMMNVAAPEITAESVRGDFVLSIDDYRRAVLDVFHQCQERGLHVFFQLGLPLCVFSKDELDELVANGAIKQGCHVPRGHGIVVDPELSMAVCTHLADFCANSGQDARRAFSSATAFLEFWNQTRLEQVRRAASVYRRPECEHCRLWNECGGGCLVHWAFHDPREFEIRYPVNEPGAEP